MTETYRLVRFLARCGVTSRRKAGELVEAGRVRLNGRVVTDYSLQVDPLQDNVEVDGRPVRWIPGHHHLLHHKPNGVLVSRTDPQGRRTVYDLLPEEHASLRDRLVYVGRLDYDSEGLLILTTDGDLANQLSHPSHGIDKEYHVWTTGDLDKGALDSLRSGIRLEDGPAAPCRVEVLGRDGILFRYSITLREGRKRQVRRMMEAVGTRVRRLVRVRIGSIKLAELGRGEWRLLTAAEVSALQAAAALPRPRDPSAANKASHAKHPGNRGNPRDLH